MTAARTLDVLGVPSPAIEVDGAHNRAGARALAAYIARFYAGRRARLIFGAMRDNAVEEIAGILFPLAQQVIIAAPRQARALSPEAIRQIADHANLMVRRIWRRRWRWCATPARRRGLHHRVALSGGGSACAVGRVGAGVPYGLAPGIGRPFAT